MSIFGERSKKALATAHPDLQRLFTRVVKIMNCTILVGHRNEEDQNKAYNQKRSKIKWPDGKHNFLPSQAVDAIPYHKNKPHIRWSDLKTIYLFSGIVLGVAAEMGIKIRWGGDWDSDKDINDQNFNDLVHFELLR